MDGRKVEFTRYEDPRPNEGWTKPQLLDFLEKHRKKGRMSRRTGKAALLKAAKDEWDRLDRNFHLHEEATRYALAVLNGEVEDVEPSVSIPNEGFVFGWVVSEDGPRFAWTSPDQWGPAYDCEEKGHQKLSTFGFFDPSPLFAIEADAFESWRQDKIRVLISELADAIGSRSDL